MPGLLPGYTGSFQGGDSLLEALQYHGSERSPVGNDAAHRGRPEMVHAPGRPLPVGIVGAVFIRILCGYVKWMLI